ncbi:hypothetical protein KQX54_021101 [Cotesia glomerata]|uniref:Uncharacterized protein n=1 Tax=Cotesia glomerata TaxID=32391 RepID=A0AAV7J9B1_COTGL|nr:hypothetical protein KQX54_021101 [Cotesia glomerata]
MYLIHRKLRPLASRICRNPRSSFLPTLEVIKSRRAASLRSSRQTRCRRDWIVDAAEDECPTSKGESKTYSNAERNGIAEEERMDDDGNAEDENEKALWAYKKMS